MAAVLKTAARGTVPGVRIPPSPPTFAHLRLATLLGELRLASHISDPDPMGAPLLNWLFRAAVTLAALAGATALVFLPAPAWVRGVLLAAGLAAGLALAFRYLPAFDPLLRIRWRLPRRARARRCCALTFDDGPSESTEAVLDILAKERVQATFFVLGMHVERHPDTIRRMSAAGHAIGIHGMEHGKLSGRDDVEVDRQIGGVLASLERLGVAPARVYRTPHGYKSAGVFEVARRRGLSVWAWSRGVWDTASPRPAVLVRRATRLARPGMVLLLHDGRGAERDPDVSAMLAALPDIVARLRRRGFTFVRLGDA
jgi:peptidoglycan-N-acetylglucosamine deacetylase